MSENQCDLEPKHELEDPVSHQEIDEISLDNLCNAIDTVVKSDIESNEGTVVIKQEEKSSDDDNDDEIGRDSEDEQDESLQPKTATKRPHSLISEGSQENVPTESIKWKKKRKRTGKKRNYEYFIAVWGFPASYTEAQITALMTEMFPNAEKFDVLEYGLSIFKVAWFKFKNNEEACAAKDLIRNGAEAGGQKLFVARDNSRLKNRILTGKLQMIKHHIMMDSQNTTTNILGEGENDETEQTEDLDIDIWDEDPSGMYGLSTEYLNKIRVKPPLSPWVHISNFSCSALRLKDLLSLAGTVLMCNIKMTDKMSKTLIAKAKFSHPIEAAQAVSMFNGISFDGDILVVAMDPNSYSINDLLPVGVKNLGPGFGIDGEPDADIVRKFQRYFQGKNVNINPQLFSDYRDLRCHKSTQTISHDETRIVTALVKELLDKGVKRIHIMNTLRRLVPEQVCSKDIYANATTKENANINDGTNDGRPTEKTQDNSTTPTTPQLQKTPVMTNPVRMRTNLQQSTSNLTSTSSSSNVPTNFTPRIGSMSNNFGAPYNQPTPLLEMNLVRPNIIRHGINRMQRPMWSRAGGNVIRPEHNIMGSGPNIMESPSNMTCPTNNNTPTGLSMMGSRHNMINSDPNVMRSEYNMMESVPNVVRPHSNMTDFRPNMDGVSHNIMGAENNNMIGAGPNIMGSENNIMRRSGQNMIGSRNNMMGSGPSIDDGGYNMIAYSGQNMIEPGNSMMGTRSNTVGPAHNIMGSRQNIVGTGYNMMARGSNMTGPGNNMISSGQNMMGFAQNMSGVNLNNTMAGSSISMEPDGNHKILLSIKNLPPSVNLEQLENKMAECGDVQFVNIVGPGSAFVRFHNELSAKKCIQFYDNSVVDGNRIQVHLA